MSGSLDLKDTVTALQHMLDYAKSGMVKGIAIAAINHDNSTSWLTAGDVKQNVPGLIGSMKIAGDSLAESLAR